MYTYCRGTWYTFLSLCQDKNNKVMVMVMKIKKCLFCGSNECSVRSVRSERHSDWVTFVYCGQCLCTGPVITSYSDPDRVENDAAVYYWNRRDSLV